MAHPSMIHTASSGCVKKYRELDFELDFTVAEDCITAYFDVKRQTLCIGNKWWGSSGSTGRIGGGKKHEIYAATFGGHLFYD